MLCCLISWKRINSTHFYGFRHFACEQGENQRSINILTDCISGGNWGIFLTYILLSQVL